MDRLVSLDVDSPRDTKKPRLLGRNRESNAGAGYGSEIWLYVESPGYFRLL